jgi:hypothetical protein
VPTEQVRRRQQSRSAALVVTLQIGAVRPSKLVLRKVPAVYVFGDSTLDVGSPGASNSAATRSPVSAIVVVATPLLSYFLYL